MRRITLVSLMMTVGACGASSRVDLHAAFASIQVDEARIEHASLALENGDPDDDARRASREEVCGASAHLCETARPLDDRDARARCQRAEERCARLSAGEP